MTNNNIIHKSNNYNIYLKSIREKTNIVQKNK